MCVCSTYIITCWGRAEEVFHHRRFSPPSSSILQLRIHPENPPTEEKKNQGFSLSLGEIINSSSYAHTRGKNLFIKNIQGAKWLVYSIRFQTDIWKTKEGQQCWLRATCYVPVRTRPQRKQNFETAQRRRRRRRRRSKSLAQDLRPPLTPPPEIYYPQTALFRKRDTFVFFFYVLYRHFSSSMAGFFCRLGQQKSYFLLHTLKRAV